MKKSNPFLAVMWCRYHTGMNDGESRLRHYSRRCKMLLSVLVITLSSTMWAASPVIVEGDIITVSGGTVSPDNPDMYVIDMGNYTNGTTYSITLNRPKGSQANYPVSIKYSWQNNDYDRGIWQFCFYADKETGEYLSDGVFEFAAGETTKTITFDANDSAKLPNSQAVVYLFFGQGSRTRAEYPVVKMNFTNPQPVTPTTGSEYPDNSPSVYTSMMFPVGYYMLMYMDGDYFGHFDVLNNTRLRINRQYLNHEANPVNISDRQLAQSQSLLLKPEQPEGAVTNILEFIYKVTEDAIISDYERTQDGDKLPPTPSFTRQADSVMNLQMAKDKTLFGKLGVDDSNYGMGDAMPVIMDDYQYMELPPRFGAITADATTYDRGATISLTVPVLNSKLMQKVYPDNRWMENVKITLDGGESFVDPSYISFDGASGTITAITEAKNETGSSVQVTAEVLLRDTRRMESRMSAGWSARDSVMNVKKRAAVRMEDDNGDKYWYIYGANTAFTVTTQQASFRAVESISFTLPKDNQININATNVNLLAKVNPVTATFKSGTWSSSNPAVAELSVDGILIPKEYGKTTITFTSDEVGYRTAKNLPENNATLIQSFDMYVVGEFPEWGISGGYEYDKLNFEPEECRMLISHNLEGNSWKVDGEVSVEVFHSEAGKYGSITDAFEVTNDMIEDNGYGNWITYRIPFDERTFPKNPTLLDDMFEDHVWAAPYKVIMSLPLKQKIGDLELTHVLRDTFYVHLNLPRQPIITLIQEPEPESLSGETVTLKYDLKYLNKKQIVNVIGFNIFVYGGYSDGAYEGGEGHPKKREEFWYLNNPGRHGAYFSEKGMNFQSGNNPATPEWLELIDKGNYFDGLLSLTYPLPAPLGELKTSGGYNPEYGLYERFLFDVKIENFTGFLGNHELLGEILYHMNSPYQEKRNVLAYTYNMDIFEEEVQYQRNDYSLHSLNDWEEQSVSQSEIAQAVEAANTTHGWYWFTNFLSGVNQRNIFANAVTTPKRWGDLVVGVTKHNSTDTIYSTTPDKFTISYPPGSYDLIFSYPKVGEKRTFSYNTDSIKGLYVLKFETHLPEKIYYMNGDSVLVEKTWNASTGNKHFILYEPAGIMGEVTYNNETTKRAGVVTPLPVFAGQSDQAYFSEIYKGENSYYVNNCTFVDPQLGVVLVDEETGEKITNARINYILRSSKTEMDTSLETVATWEQVQAVAANENWSAKGVGLGADYYFAQNEQGKQTLQTYLDRFKKDIMIQRVSSFGGVAGDKYVTGNPASSVSEVTGGVFLLPMDPNYNYRFYTVYRYNIPYYSDRRYETAMEILVDGYYPKFASYGTLGTVGADEYIGGNIVYIAGQGYQYQITVPLKKNTDTQRQDNVRLWTEVPNLNVIGASANMISKNPIQIGVQAEYYSPTPMSPVEKSDQKSLNKLSTNSITAYTRYADTKNAVLNVSMPIENDWNPADILLTDAGETMEPLHYSIISAETGYTNFEKRFVNLSYRLNDFIGYGELKYPTVTYNGMLLASLPGLINDETDPGIYEQNITQGMKDNIVLNPSQFDVKEFGKDTDLGSTKGAMSKMGDLNLSLPDPIPFEIQTRNEGNRYFLRGVLSHNFIDDIPLVGQANAAMSMYKGITENAEQFEAAFGEIKKQVGLFKPKRSGRRFSTISTFAGLRGYMEGYGEYNPFTGDFEYGLNEGGISLELSASAYVNTSFVIGKIGVGLDALASATLGFSKPSDADWAKAVNKAKFDMWMETQLSMDVYVDISAGLDLGIMGAEVGVSGNAGFLNKNKVVIKPYLADNKVTAGGLFNAHASLYLWAHAYFLCWSWEDEWKIFDVDKTWYYPNNNNNPYKAIRNNPQMRTLSQAYSRNSLAMPNTIISNVAANVYPRYFSDGNSLMLANLKAPSEQNDDRISVYSSGSVTDMLPSATLPAFGFDVATSPNGVSVAAYEQMSDSIRPKAVNISPETYIKTQSQQVEIFAAINNGGEWQETQLSDVNTGLGSRNSDISPKVAISDNGTRASVVWKSGHTRIDSLGAKISGNLKLSRYNGSFWKEPIELVAADNISDYSISMNGESVLIAATRVESDNSGRIKLIHISPADSITHIETGRQGKKPQITRAGDNFYVSFMGSYALNDTTNLSDMYLLATSQNGLLLDSISGFAGMTSNVSFDYKLVGEKTAAGIQDLAILYQASKVVSEAGDVETSLYASKFGRQNSKIYASEPTKLLTIPDDGSQLILSYDGYKQGNNLKAAAVISNKSHGAIVVEESTTFENRIVCMSESFNNSDVKIGSDVDVEFAVKNAGYKPITSMVVSIGGNQPTTLSQVVMPGQVPAIRGRYVIFENNTDSVDYTITAQFNDGTNAEINGKLNLTAYQIKVNLVSLKNSDSKNTAVLEVVNNSATPLTTQHSVTVGIYEDIFGETLYPGTSLKTIAASELYADGKAKIATTALDIPAVNEIQSVYAIAKVKKTNVVSRVKGATVSEESDQEQSSKNYASIQLFPSKDDIATKIETPKKEGETENGDKVRIYVVNKNACIEIPDLHIDEKQGLSIHSITGMIVHKAVLSERITCVPLKPGVYIVTVGTKTKKIIVM